MSDDTRRVDCALDGCRKRLMLGPLVDPVAALDNDDRLGSGVARDPVGVCRLALAASGSRLDRCVRRSVPYPGPETGRLKEGRRG